MLDRFLQLSFRDDAAVSQDPREYGQVPSEGMAFYQALRRWPEPGPVVFLRGGSSAIIQNLQHMRRATQTPPGRRARLRPT
jgi:hypothetical protein